MARRTILAIDDDRPILELISSTLQAADFDVITSSDPLAGLEIAATQRVDLIVLDVRMPSMNGFEVCRRLRADQATRAVPIMMLTVDASEPDRIAGFDSGADDYMAKPFSPRELVARIRAILRRTTDRPEASTDGTISVGPVIIDQAAHEVRVGAEPVSLTVMEFKVLVFLASHAGEVVTRDQIIQGVSDSESAVLDRTIDVHVAALRRKLGNAGEMIQTVRGVGYRLRSV